MLRKIKGLTMCDELADYACSSVRYLDFDERTDDGCLLAAARILLTKRGFPLTIEDIEIENYIYETDFVTGLFDQKNELCICRTLRDQEDFYAERDPKKAGLEGFVYIEPVSKYISKRTTNENAVFMCNPDSHKSIIFTDIYVEVSFERTVASILPAILPWVFKEEPRTKEEEHMLMTIGDFKSSREDIVQNIEALSEQYHLLDYATDYYLDNFESGIKDELIVSTANKIAELQNKIDSLHDQIAKNLKCLMQNQEYLSGLRLINDKPNGLLQYFKANKKLHVVRNRDRINNEIVYVVTGYMDDFDIEMYMLIRENEESYLYNAYSQVSQPTLVSREDYLLLMDGLFKDEKIKLKLCSAWTLSSSDIRCVKDYNFEQQFLDYMPNSHLQDYGCYGSFRKDLEEAMIRHDYEYAVDISSAENGNINLNDSIVIPHSFIPELLHTQNAVIELPDGRSVSTIQAVEWLKEENDGKDN